MLSKVRSDAEERSIFVYRVRGIERGVGGGGWCEGCEALSGGVCGWGFIG